MEPLEIAHVGRERVIHVRVNKTASGRSAVRNALASIAGGMTFPEGCRIEFDGTQATVKSPRP